MVAVFCASILAGIGMSRGMTFDVSILFMAAMLSIVTVRHKKFAAVLCVILLGISIGGLRGSSFMDKLTLYEPVYDQKVVLVGRAVDDAGYGKKSQLSFDLTDAKVVDGGSERLIGKIGVSGFGANMIFRGDTVQVEGKLRQGTGARQGWMSFAKLTVLENNMTPIDKLRRNFGAGMQSVIPEPAASFAMGLLIGQRATLPDSVYDDLVAVGLVHIIAVSGYNLTIILRASWRLLGDKSKYQTLFLSVVLIGTFLLLTGSSASIVRASIVSGLSIAAWYYGRRFKPVTLILMTAAITAYASPLYPWGDIGWYLSFLAFYGILILSPQIRHRALTGRFKDSTLVLIALESLSAEIMTLPLILYIFGQLSIISLLANVLVAAFVPLAMLLSMVAGLVGMLITPIAGWFGWPASILLTYMLDAARILANVPFAFVENLSLSLAGMVGFYAIILSFNLLLHSRLKQNSDIIKELNAEHTLLRPVSSRSA